MAFEHQIAKLMQLDALARILGISPSPFESIMIEVSEEG